MRRNVWGWANPKTTILEWLNATYYNVIYAKESRKKVNIINMPLFKCTIIMEDVLNVFVGGVHFVDRPISGYNNWDEIISDWETIHKTYCGYNNDNHGAAWTHFSQTYQTKKQKLQQEKGKYVNKQPLWKSTGLIGRRIDAVWNPKYLHACFNIQFLTQMSIGHIGTFYIIFSSHNFSIIFI